MSELHRRLKLSKLPPMAPNIGARGGRGGRRTGPMRRDYSPVTWDKYFQTEKDVQLENNDIFRVYEVGSEGPVCFFLHGGGFSALSWALLAKDLTSQVKCRCVAVDLRAHGDTRTTDEQDLSADQLASDVAAVISALYGDDLPPIILIGHSMGGAIGVHTVFRDLVPTVIGLVVIDVVEGTALDALSSMQSFLLTRPRTFKSVEYAVEWCVRSGQVRNLESAKVSMVGQVKRLGTNETAASELNHSQEIPQDDTSVIQEEEEEEEESSTRHPSQSQQSPYQPDQSEQSPYQTGQSEQSPYQPDQSQQSPYQPEQSPYQTGQSQGTPGQTDQSKETSHLTGKSEQTSPKIASPSTGNPPDQTQSEAQQFKKPSQSSNAGNLYTWRINLSNTEKYWRGWFEGLSQKFLACNVPKLLILAGVNRLDRDLTVGQMQGRFQMHVLPQSGHAVHEDVPEKVSEVLATYMVRHKYAEPCDDFNRVFPAC